MKIINTLLATAILCVVSLGAHASWLCSVNNDKGQTWNGTGLTRADALENAMGFCSKNSVSARNCAVRNCAQR